MLNHTQKLMLLLFNNMQEYRVKVIALDFN